jgi:DNA-binding GntR family transcriptional regulator
MSPQGSAERPTPRTRERSPERVSLSVVDQVTNQLIEMIVSGELKPTQALPIVELASDLGVSHIPVREALRRLEGDGLILYHRGKGAQVAPVSRQEITDIFTVRAALEPDVARRSVSLLDADRLEFASRMLDEYVTSLGQDRGTPSAVSPPHLGFHLALLPGASDWDLKILGQLFRGTERYMQLYRGYARWASDALEELVDSHKALLAAAGSGQRAFVSAARDHIKWSETVILSLFDSQDPDS